MNSFEGYPANYKLFTKDDMKIIFAYAYQIGMNAVLQVQSPLQMKEQNDDELRDKFIENLLKIKENEQTK